MRTCLILFLVSMFSVAHPVLSLEFSPTVPSKKRVLILRGSNIYRDNCLACHGKYGAGREAVTVRSKKRPPDFSDPSFHSGRGRDQLIAGVNAGHKIDTSRHWRDRLSHGQISNVVDFIREAFMTPAATADIQLGEGIYSRTCSVCHGEKGNGAFWARQSFDPSPLDFTSYKAKKLKRRHMLNAVTFGKDGTAMMAFSIQLSAVEISSVVEYVRSAFIFGNYKNISSKRGKTTNPIPENGKKAGNERVAFSRTGRYGAAAPDMAAPLPRGLKGDAVKGKIFFEQNCAVCHGKQGWGKGPRAYFIFPKPANFRGKRARAEFNRPHLFKSISQGILGTVMPAWSKVLNDQEIANVAEYVFSAFVGQARIGSSRPAANSAENRGDRIWRRHLGETGIDSTRQNTSPQSKKKPEPHRQN